MIDGLLEFIIKYKWFFLFILFGAAAIFPLLLLFRNSRLILIKAWLYICTLSVKAIGKFKDALIIYCRSPLTILAVFGLTIFLQIMTITGFWFLGVDLGVDVSIKYYYVFFTLTWILGAIPVSIGGAVVVEVSLASMFIKFAGISEVSAAALVICQRLIWMLVSLPGAVIHLSGAHLPKDFFIDYNKPIN